MTEQPHLFEKKPRKWEMVEALGTLEWFLADAERRGMTGKEAIDWARQKTWQKLEHPETMQGPMP